MAWVGKASWRRCPWVLRMTAQRGVTWSFLWWRNWKQFWELGAGPLGAIAPLAGATRLGSGGWPRGCWKYRNLNSERDIISDLLVFVFKLCLIGCEGVWETESGSFSPCLYSSYREAQQDILFSLLTDQPLWQVGGSREVRKWGGTWKEMRYFPGGYWKKRNHLAFTLHKWNRKRRELVRSQGGVPHPGEKEKKKQTCFAGSKAEVFELCSGKVCFRESHCVCVTQPEWSLEIQIWPCSALYLESLGSLSWGP